MAVEYVNRRGDTYYLHEGKSRSGTPKYYFSKKKDERYAGDIPPGHEIYESPNARVYLRKIPQKIIRDNEVAVVEDAVRKLSDANRPVVEVKGRAIVVHLPDQDLDSLVDKLGALSGNPARLRDLLVRDLTYGPMMRFVLVDEESRIFAVERWCFLGSIDDWIPLAECGDLPALAATYCRHLGRNSFYELM